MSAGVLAVISQQGFDTSLAKESGRLGRGSYFARDISHALSFAKQVSTPSGWRAFLSCGWCHCGRSSALSLSNSQTTHRQHQTIDLARYTTDASVDRLLRCIS